MTDEDIKMLTEASDRLISRVPMQFRRYLAPDIDWNEKMLCIKGPKGTGKTTMILQHIKETFGSESDKAIYFALDHVLFSDNRPIDAIEYFYTHGFTHLFIDEVHHLPEWSRVIKTITDCYPKLNVKIACSRN